MENVEFGIWLQRRAAGDKLLAARWDQIVQVEVER